MDAYQHLQLLRRHDRLRALRGVVDGTVKPGDRVLDAGCGAGLLSIWAALAGAAEVVAVDLEAVPLAERLAEENGVRAGVRFVEADLRDLTVDDIGEFDVVLAMLYLNDPRRDRAQADLVHDVCERFLRPGGTVVPDRLTYEGRIVAWPDQNHDERISDICQQVSGIEEIVGLSLGALAEQSAAGPFLPWFPVKADGVYRHDYVELSDVASLPPVDYASWPPYDVGTLEVPVRRSGCATAVVWKQQLRAGDEVIFQNESISWIQPAIQLLDGTTATIELGDEFTERNVVRVGPGTSGPGTVRNS